MKKEISLAIVSGILIAASLYAANEITANFTLRVLKGNLDITKTIGQKLTLTCGTPNVAGLTQLVTTNPVGEAITLGNVSTNGVAWFSCLDTNHFVEIGVQDANTNFLPLIRLNAGEAWVTRLSQGITPYARANGASVVMEKLIFDN